MKLVMEIESGELAGHKRWLRPGERMMVGRTDQAELSVPDPKMSEVHFFVEFTAEASRIHDMRSTNGTFVNGERVAKGALHDGDRIVAGETVFRIQINEDASRIATPTPPPTDNEAPGAAGGIRRTVIISREPAAPVPASSELAIPPSATPAPVAQAPPSQEPDATAPAKPTLEAQQPVAVPVGDPKPILSGAVVSVFSTGADVAGQIAEKLSAIAPLFLVVEFAKLAKPVPDELATASFLYDWFPEKLIPSFSPVLFSSSTALDWRGLLQLGWGHNGMLCLCSHVPEAELAQHLKKLTRWETVEDQPRPFACPDALRELLSAGPESFAREFFRVVDAVLLEAEDGDRNEVIATPELAAQVREIRVL